MMQTWNWKVSMFLYFTENSKKKVLMLKCEEENNVFKSMT